jgi:hypothetical protein
MRTYTFAVLGVVLFCTSLLRAQPNPNTDWLIHAPKSKAQVMLSKNGRDIELNNGLLRRSFRLQPNLVCFDYHNLSNGQQLIRALRPEAKVTIDGNTYAIGGLYGQKEQAYLLTEWLDAASKKEQDFQYQSYAIAELLPYLKWTPKTWASNLQNPRGKVLSLTFKHADPKLAKLKIQVHYALYEGLPLVCKWLTIDNESQDQSFKINRVVNEILAMPEEESAVVGKPEQMKKPQGMYIESNYAFNNAMRYSISDQTTHWKIDSTYTSQVNYNYETPCVLEIYPDFAPGIDLQPGEHFESVRSYELLMDSDDRERRGLMVRKMYRCIAPWTTQNPIFMHLVSKNDEEVRKAIDQCKDTGYEALILSFGSHCNMEDTSAANIRRWRSLSDYAHQKNILIGSYSLFSSRKISEEHDVISPLTGKTGGAFFGNAPCMGSVWGLAYLQKLKYFMSQVKFDIFENDGPYPGDRCASTSHPGHQGLDDSQWRQMQLQKGLYHWCNENGIYVNAPDWYFLDGTHKIALGYREVNFSLPRAQQKILNRQNIFDGTWEKTPSMGWGFVPLTAYQGGGAEAVLEPLDQHLQDYEQLMVQYYGAGVQACYRGPRLYDTERTRQKVTEIIAWYKQYRQILNADIIHLRRPDGRDWDGILHAAPQLPQKGFLLLYNPLKVDIQRKIAVPLYYTGLHQSALFKDQTGKSQRLNVDRNYSASLSVSIPAEGYVWYVIE